VSRTSVHVLEMIDAACDDALAQRIVALTAQLRAAGARVSALCHQDVPAAARLRGGGIDLVVAPLDDAPRWRTVQIASAWIAQEDVDVLHAHGGGAHALGALVGAITERPILASIRGPAVPMLDLEAHRLGPWSHIAVDDEAALRQAATLGIARHRIARVDDAPRATIDLLLRLASSGDAERSTVPARRAVAVHPADGSRMR
jgi:hypothetical protein